MYLLYVDESGKSGLDDPDQPHFILGGLAVHESSWQEIEADLDRRIDMLFPPPRPEDWEIHMSEIWSGKGHFKSIATSTRLKLVSAACEVIEDHKPTLFCIVIDKAKLKAQYAYPDPPEDIAYQFMIERFEMFLAKNDELGVIVSDEQKGAENVIRSAHSGFRKAGTGYVNIDHVIETPFFIPSHWSRMIQLTDLATWFCARHFRAKNNGKPLPPEWETCLVPRLDCHPNHGGKGLKVFP